MPDKRHELKGKIAEDIASQVSTVGAAVEPTIDQARHRANKAVTAESLAEQQAAFAAIEAGSPTALPDKVGQGIAR